MKKIFYCVLMYLGLELLYFTYLSLAYRFEGGFSYTVYNYERFDKDFLLLVEFANSDSVDKFLGEGHNGKLSSPYFRGDMNKFDTAFFNKKFGELSHKMGLSYFEVEIVKYKDKGINKSIFNFSGGSIFYDNEPYCNIVFTNVEDLEELTEKLHYRFRPYKKGVFIVPGYQNGLIKKDSEHYDLLINKFFN